MKPKKHHPFAGIEIPVIAMERAVLIYEKVFQMPLKWVDFGGLQMAWFPNVGAYIPGATGKLIRPKTQISPQYGNMVVIKNTEGNRIALYAAI